MRRFAILAAILVAVAPERVRAAAPHSCVPNPKSLNESVPGLKEVIACQKRAIEDFKADYKKKNGADPSDALIERLRDGQRAETRDFIRRYPEKAVVDESPELLEKEEREADPIEDGLASLKAKIRELKKSLRGSLKDYLPASLLSYLEDSGETKKAAPDLEKVLDSNSELKSFSRQAKKGGFDFKKAVEDAKKDPEGTMKKAAHNYNTGLKEKMDPSMRKFYDFKDGK